MNVAKIMFTTNWDWVFYNFRRRLAHTLRENGYDVTLVCPRGTYIEELTGRDGFRWIEWTLERRSLNPVREVRAVWDLARIYRQEDPDIIHHDTIKPNLYGSLATFLNRFTTGSADDPVVLSTFMGIGFLFSDRLKARLLRLFVLPVMRLALGQEHVRTVFSNESDRRTFLDLGLIHDTASTVMVSEFVDTSRFRPRQSELDTKQGGDASNEVVVLMAARMLWDKGVAEFVEAARRLEDRGVPVRMCLAGAPDTESPGFVPDAKLREWDQAGIVEWLEYRSDMPELLRHVDVGVLPTHYNEGLPRFLVEAASSGLPLVASDIAACRRIVRDGENGLLVPREDSEALADAIEVLANDPSLRKAMGGSSRARAKQDFSETKVIQEWLRLYDSLTNGVGNGL